MKKSTKKLVFWSLGAVGAVVVVSVLVKKYNDSKMTSQAIIRQNALAPTDNPALSGAGFNTYAVRPF